MRRNVDQSLVVQVEAELKAKQGAVKPEPVQASQPFVAPPPPPVTIPVETPKFEQAPIVAPPVVSQIPVYSDVAIPQDTKPAHSFETFRKNLIPIFTKLINEGKLTSEYLAEATKYFGVSGIWDIAKDETKCRELFEGFVAFGYITKVD
jgi:hypothetical protein